jgi:hypothetical protein
MHLIFFNEKMNHCWLCIAIILIVFVLYIDCAGIGAEPAIDCEHVANTNCNAPSGFYYIQLATAPRQMYCEMDIDGGGWLRMFDLFDHSCRDFGWSSSGLGGSLAPPVDGCVHPCKDLSCQSAASQGLGLCMYVSLY